MKNLYIGKDPIGKKVYLTEEDFETHFHICGLSRSGKSRLIEHILREFVISRIPFVLIDPHGELYRNLLHWLAYTRINRPILLLDPSYEHRIVGFNPFLTSYSDSARITIKVDRMVKATVKVWGLENTDNLGNIERWLSNIYYVILEQGLTIADISLFTIWKNKAERDKILRRVRNEDVRAELTDFYDVSKTELKKDILTTRNKLRRFTHPQTRRTMGLKTNNIDLSQFISGEQTLLVNLQAAEDDLTGFENNRTIGALFLSEMWELFMKRTSSQELCLVIDEFPTIPSVDLEKMLRQTGKYGLHLFLAHQDTDQVQKAGMTGAIQNAQTKITFRTEESPKEKRHFTLRRADHSTVKVQTPEVTSFEVSPQRIRELIECLTKNFLTIEEVDSLLHTTHNEDDDEIKDEDLFR